MQSLGDEGTPPISALIPTLTRRVRVVLVAALSVVVVSCSTSAPDADSRPRTDEEQIKELAINFRDALKSRDVDRFLALLCPGVKSKVEPNEWFKDADRIGEFSRADPFTPTDGSAYAPNASEWRRAYFIKPDGRVRIAKINGSWYVCES